MQKIKLAIINKMIEQKLTSKEVLFLLWISHFQNDKGQVLGVNYKEMFCNNQEKKIMSHQKFYEVLQSLSEKCIIEKKQNHYGDWDITILNNNFENYDYENGKNENGKKEGYIDTGLDIFYDKHFFQFKGKEMLLSILLLCWSRQNGGKYHSEKEEFSEKYSNLLGVTKRSLKRYITNLKTYFYINIYKGVYWFTPKTGVYRTGNHKDDKTYREHIGRVICRRQHVKYDKKSLEDTSELITQYREHTQESIIEVFSRAIAASVKKINENINNISCWKRTLQSKLVHKMMRNEIAILE